MANMLQSSQTKSTCAPQYYNDYLSNLANAGRKAQEGAQYVGAQPLQEQAFNTAAQNAGQYQPYFQQGACLAGQSAGQDIQGAAQPFLGAAAMRGGLCVAMPFIAQGAGTNISSAANPYFDRAVASGGICAATPYLCRGVNTNILGAANPYLNAAFRCSPATLAQCYMNPYINTAVQQMSDIGQRNIQRNIAPQATAAAVGSGQFGSQRGAQVLGQVENDAQQNLNSQLSQMLSQGYGQALSAAQQRQALLGQLGQTAGSLEAQQAQQALSAGQTAGSLAQQQQALLGQLGTAAGCMAAKQGQQAITAGQTAGNLSQQQQQLLGQLGSTAGNLAAQKAQTLNQAGQTIGQLGSAGQNANLACINALATLGGQQQTIGQNEQLFPMSTLSQLSQLLQGYSVPTANKTTLCMSPLSGVATVGSTIGGLLQPRYDSSGNLLANSSLWDTIANKFFKNTGSTNNNAWSNVNPTDYFNFLTGGGGNYQTNCCEGEGGKRGGLVSTQGIGCSSTRYYGALPKE